VAIDICMYRESPELLVNRATFGLLNLGQQHFLLKLHTYRDSIVKKCQHVGAMVLR